MLLIVPHRSPLFSPPFASKQARLAVHRMPPMRGPIAPLVAVVSGALVAAMVSGALVAAALVAVVSGALVAAMASGVLVAAMAAGALVAVMVAVSFVGGLIAGHRGPSWKAL